MNMVSHNGLHLYLHDPTHFSMFELPHPFHTNTDHLDLQPRKISFCFFLCCLVVFYLVCSINNAVWSIQVFQKAFCV